MAGRVEQIDIPAESVVAGYLPVALRPNQSVSSLLTITCFEQQGYMIEIRDPIGMPVWSIMLNCVGGVNGPDFGKEYVESNGG